MKPSPAERIIVALDTDRISKAEGFLKKLRGLVSFYKIGLELFTAEGWEAVALVQKYKARVFLDLKLHDIPTTVAKTARVLCQYGVDMFNVHTLGGLEMMKQASSAVEESCKNKKRKRPLVLGVTVLTSHAERVLSEELKIGQRLEEQVIHLAALAQKAGLDGVVSPAQETASLRRKLPRDFMIVTPGIRLPQDKKDDQKRTFTPQEAFAAGSDYLVIGRPITQAKDPREVMLTLLSDTR